MGSSAPIKVEQQTQTQTDKLRKSITGSHIKLSPATTSNTAFTSSSKSIVKPKYNDLMLLIDLGNTNNNKSPNKQKTKTDRINKAKTQA